MQGDRRARDRRVGRAAIPIRGGVHHAARHGCRRALSIRRHSKRKRQGKRQ